MKTIVFGAFLIVLTSCIQKEENLTNDGPEYSASEVNAALAEATSTKRISHSKKGDWVLFQETQKVFNTPPETSKIYSNEIDQMDLINGIYDIKIIKKEYDLHASPPVITRTSIDNCNALEDGSRHSCSYSPQSKSRQAGPDLSQANFVRPNRFGEIQALANGVTFHNLSVTKRNASPPDQVNSKPGCKGIPQCQITLTTVEFDQIGHDNDGERIRYHHVIDLSSDVPFLSIILRHCTAWNYKTGGRYVPVELCSKSVDFEFGS